MLASALTGRSGGLVDVRPWVRAFDTGLCGDPSLAALPGRFLVAFDDGRGDVAGQGADVALRALGPGSAALLLAGHDSGLRADHAGAVDLALAASRAFVAERAAQGGTAWRLGELADGPARVAATLGDPVPVRIAPAPPSRPDRPAPCTRTTGGRR